MVHIALSDVYKHHESVILFFPWRSVVFRCLNFHIGDLSISLPVYFVNWVMKRKTWKIAVQAYSFYLKKIATLRVWLPTFKSQVPTAVTCPALLTLPCNSLNLLKQLQVSMLTNSSIWEVKQQPLLSQVLFSHLSKREQFHVLKILCDT